MVNFNSLSKLHLITVLVQNFVVLKFAFFTTPFSGYFVRWYSWIGEQVLAKEFKNNTQTLEWSVHGWTKVTKECHSRACLAQ